MFVAWLRFWLSVFKVWDFTKKRTQTAEAKAKNKMAIISSIKNKLERRGGCLSMKIPLSFIRSNKISNC